MKVLLNISKALLGHQSNSNPKSHLPLFFPLRKMELDSSKPENPRLEDFLDLRYIFDPNITTLDEFHPGLLFASRVSVDSIAKYTIFV